MKLERQHCTSEYLGYDPPPMFPGSARSVVRRTRNSRPYVLPGMFSIDVIFTVGLLTIPITSYDEEHWNYELIIEDFDEADFDEEDLY